MGNEENGVVQYQSAYPQAGGLRSLIDLCDEHAANPPSWLPSLGPVSRGRRHNATCDACERERQSKTA